MQQGVPVLLASRSGSTLDGLKSCRFDWLEEATYANPFNAASDISALYIVPPEIDDMLSPVRAFIDYALKKGVSRLVLLSTSSIECGGPAHGQIHEYIKSLNVEYGIIRRTFSYYPRLAKFRWTRWLKNSAQQHGSKRTSLKLSFFRLSERAGKFVLPPIMARFLSFRPRILPVLLSVCSRTKSHIILITWFWDQNYSHMMM